MKSIIISSLLATSTLFAQSGASLFKNNCSSCHIEVLGINESGGVITNIYSAPYAKDIVDKLKVEIKDEDEFVSFIKDYINMPSTRKSLYSKKAIKKFGLMPSLSGVLTDDESTRLAKYLYNDYGKDKVLKSKNSNKISDNQNEYQHSCA